jgi:hypothetical protein
MAKQLADKIAALEKLTARQTVEESSVPLTVINTSSCNTRIEPLRMEVKPDLHQVIVQLIEEVRDLKRQAELLSCDGGSTASQQQTCPCSIRCDTCRHFVDSYSVSDPHAAKITTINDPVSFVSGNL